MTNNSASGRHSERSGYPLGIMILALFLLCVALAYPFLPALTWGIALAVIAWPLRRWIAKRVNESWAAALATLVVAVAIVVPGLWVAYQMGREATVQAQQLSAETDGNDVKGTLARIPHFQEIARWLERLNINLEEGIRQIATRATQDATALLQGSILGLVQFVLALMLAFYFLKDGPSVRESVKELLPLSRRESERVFGRVADSIHANLYANVLTSVIDAVSGGLLFWLFGVPSAVLWASVMFVLSLLPMLGMYVVWVPVAIFLAATGNAIGAGVIAVWGVVASYLVDNLLYAKLAGDRMGMHPVAALLAFLGGLALFGVSGMVLGPAIVAVTLALLEVWQARSQERYELVQNHFEIKDRSVIPVP